MSLCEITKVVKYQTSDNKLHDSYDEAKRWSEMSSFDETMDLQEMKDNWITRNRDEDE